MIVGVSFLTELGGMGGSFGQGIKLLGRVGGRCFGGGKGGVGHV